MEWQAIVLTLQILLLAIGWTLFQKARAELSARAAEAPILGEVKALQRNVKQLLAEIEQTADRTAVRLEDRILEARSVATDLEARLTQEARRQEDLLMQEAQRKSEVELEPALSEPRKTPRGRKTKPASAAPEFMEAVIVDRNIVQGIAGHMENQERVPGEGATHTLRQSRRNTIYQLADAGESPAAIARMTKLTEGEVETQLGLRRRHS